MDQDENQISCQHFSQIWRGVGGSAVLYIDIHPLQLHHHSDRSEHVEDLVSLTKEVKLAVPQSFRDVSGKADCACGEKEEDDRNVIEGRQAAVLVVCTLDVPRHQRHGANQRVQAERGHHDALPLSLVRIAEAKLGQTARDETKNAKRYVRRQYVRFDDVIHKRM